MKPIYKSRKFWVSIVTAATTVVAHYYDEKLSQMICTIGMTLIAGFGLEDFSKNKQ